MSDSISSECKNSSQFILKSNHGWVVHDFITLYLLIIVSFFRRNPITCGLWWFRKGYSRLHFTPTGQTTFRGYFSNLRETRFCNYGCSLHKPLSYYGRRKLSLQNGVLLTIHNSSSKFTNTQLGINYEKSHSFLICLGTTTITFILNGRFRSLHLLLLFISKIFFPF